MTKYKGIFTISDEEVLERLGFGTDVFIKSVSIDPLTGDIQFLCETNNQHDRFWQIAPNGSIPQTRVKLRNVSEEEWEEEVLVKEEIVENNNFDGKIYNPVTDTWNWF